jgi:hypothetical protein
MEFTTSAKSTETIIDTLGIQQTTAEAIILFFERIDKLSCNRRIYEFELIAQTEYLFKCLSAKGRGEVVNAYNALRATEVVQVSTDDDAEQISTDKEEENAKYRVVWNCLIALLIKNLSTAEFGHYFLPDLMQETKPVSSPDLSRLVFWVQLLLHWIGVKLFGKAAYKFTIEDDRISKSLKSVKKALENKRYVNLQANEDFIESLEIIANASLNSTPKFIFINQRKALITNAIKSCVQLSGAQAGNGNIASRLGEALEWFEEERKRRLEVWDETVPTVAEYSKYLAQEQIACEDYDAFSEDGEDQCDGPNQKLPTEELFVQLIKILEEQHGEFWFFARDKMVKEVVSVLLELVTKGNNKNVENNAAPAGSSSKTPHFFGAANKVWVANPQDSTASQVEVVTLKR